MSKFEDAVSFAAEWLRSTEVQKNRERYPAEPTEFLYVFGLPIGHEFDAHRHCGSKYTVDDASLEWLHMRSEMDKGAFDLLLRIAVTRLLRNEPLAHSISFFAGMVLAGLVKPPAPEGKRLARHFTANVHLVFLAHELSRGFDLSLMRNDETTVEESACDAVSQALAALGINKSPRAIKDLLVHKSASRVREIVQAVQDFNQRQREAGKPA